MILIRPPVRVGLLTFAMAATAVGGEVQRGGVAPTRSNLASGASWQIKVGSDKDTMDSYPARISDGQISQHDPTDGGNYTLDRKSGELTVVFASSTGGYFLQHRRFRRFGALEDLLAVSTGLSVHAADARPTADQSTSKGILPFEMDHRHALLRSERRNRLALAQQRPWR